MADRSVPVAVVVFGKAGSCHFLTTGLSARGLKLGEGSSFLSSSSSCTSLLPALQGSLGFPLQQHHVAHQSVLRVPGAVLCPLSLLEQVTVACRVKGGKRGHVFVVSFSWRTNGIFQAGPGLSRVVLHRLQIRSGKPLNATEGKLRGGKGEEMRCLGCLIMAGNNKNAMALFVHPLW